jgi:hypothetical protein
VEFDEDSSSEMEFYEDAEDFDGNDTKMFISLRPDFEQHASTGVSKRK